MYLSYRRDVMDRQYTPDFNRPRMHFISPPLSLALFSLSSGILSAAARRSALFYYFSTLRPPLFFIQLFLCMSHTAALPLYIPSTATTSFFPPSFTCFFFYRSSCVSVAQIRKTMKEKNSPKTITVRKARRNWFWFFLYRSGHSMASVCSSTRH